MPIQITLVRSNTSAAFAVLIYILSLTLLSCTGERSKLTDTPDFVYPAIIPKPTLLVPTNKIFYLKPSTYIIAPKPLMPLAEYLRDGLGSQFGNMPIDPSPTNDRNTSSIYFILHNDPDLGDEGYDLRITENEIRLAAATSRGIFWGIQTLKQIVPLQSARTGESKLELASANIRDVPRFKWRGTMLDVARHFFSVDDVKRYIDLVTAYKINVLHLHLTDDQGWRLEIKSWPRLTSVGGLTEVGGSEGGYYTQQDYREIVQYAQSRFIIIVPEIDLPGHINAALTAYGELNCDGKNREPYTGIEVGFSFLCPGKSITKQFITDVLTEVAQLTPGPYFHIGGDEVKQLSPREYADFIDHARAIVERNGKHMVGWEEIIAANINHDTVVQHWHSLDQIKSAGMKDLNIILSPATITYLDMKYDILSRIGQDWAAFIEVKDTYDWNPRTYLDDPNQNRLLGIESPLWTETVASMDDIEYLVFPRLLSLAEVAWTAQTDRNWEDFKVRLAAHGPRMEQQEIDYYPSPQIPWAR